MISDTDLEATVRPTVATLVLTLIGLTVCAYAAEPTQMEATMTARGTFDVKVIPQPADDSAAGPFGRLFLAKQFHGDLEGESKGQMIASQSADRTSGGYGALELVTGTLNGKPGSFVLLHKGTMQGGNYALDVTVVPDSGTDALTGITGKMTIVIEGGKHSWELEYTLAGK